jgi:hypothetical protein
MVIWPDSRRQQFLLKVKAVDRGEDGDLVDFK